MLLDSITLFIVFKKRISTSDLDKILICRPHLDKHAVRLNDVECLVEVFQFEERIISTKQNDVCVLKPQIRDITILSLIHHMLIDFERRRRRQIHDCRVSAAHLR